MHESNFNQETCLAAGGVWERLKEETASLERKKQRLRRKE